METNELRKPIRELIGPRLEGLQKTAAGMFLVGLVLCGISAALNLAGVFHSYLFAWFFWTGVTSGSLALLMLHHVVGGGWSFLLRRFAEAATRLLPWMLLLFLPVVIGLWSFGLYEWNHPEAAHDHILQQKERWLNVPWFLIRSGIYFGIWIALATAFARWGATQDERVDPRVVHRLNLWGGLGIVTYVLTTTFSAVDWIMSLTPHWYSSIFGMLVVVSQGLSTLALMIVLLSRLAGDTPLLSGVRSGYFRDQGNLMLAFVMLWAYMAFSQYLITYSGNTVEEVSWYVRRTQTSWVFVGITLIALHFAIPFLVLLLGSKVKRNPNRLAQVAGLLLFMRLVDLFWWVAPTFRPHLSLAPADFGAPLLIGGIWLWLWSRELLRCEQPVVPLHDPRLESGLQEAMSHG